MRSWSRRSRESAAPLNSTARYTCAVGCVRVQVIASHECIGDEDALKVIAVSSSRMLDSELPPVKSGLLDRAQADDMAAAIKVWAESPGAFRARAHCEAVGRAE